MKRGIAIVLMSVMVLGCIAAGHLTYGASNAEASLIVPDANNQYCPVTGNKITVKKFNTVYNGKRYWFTSFQAVQDFKAADDREKERMLRRAERGR